MHNQALLVATGCLHDVMRELGVVNPPAIRISDRRDWIRLFAAAGELALGQPAGQFMIDGIKFVHAEAPDAPARRFIDQEIGA